MTKHEIAAELRWLERYTNPLLLSAADMLDADEPVVKDSLTTEPRAGADGRALGQVAKRAYWDLYGESNGISLDRVWDRVAAAVIAHHERSQWRSIAEAPRDGTPVDLWVVWSVKDQQRVPNATWSKSRKCWCSSQFSRLTDEVTHWRPLPTPPEVGR